MRTKIKNFQQNQNEVPAKSIIERICVNKNNDIVNRKSYSSLQSLASTERVSLKKKIIIKKKNQAVYLIKSSKMKIGSAGETINHLLLHCLIARELGSMEVTLFEVSWVMPKDVVELTARWPGKFRKHRNGVIWNLVPHSLMQGIWRERNAQIFEGIERAIHEPKMTFL